jgi:hypothetical protein
LFGSRNQVVKPHPSSGAFLPNTPVPVWIPISLLPSSCSLPIKPRLRFFYAVHLQTTGKSPATLVGKNVCFNGQGFTHSRCWRDSSDSQGQSSAGTEREALSWNLYSFPIEAAVENCGIRVQTTPSHWAGRPPMAESRLLFQVPAPKNNRRCRAFRSGSGDGNFISSSLSIYLSELALTPITGFSTRFREGTLPMEPE